MSVAVKSMEKMLLDKTPIEQDNNDEIDENQLEDQDDNLVDKSDQDTPQKILKPLIVKNDDGPVRKWEKRWVLQPNVIEYGSEIWINKWVWIVYNKNLEQQPYQSVVSMINQIPGAMNSASHMDDGLSNSAEDAYQKQGNYKRTESMQPFYEPVMIEQPRKRLICQYDECNKTFQDQGSLK